MTPTTRRRVLTGCAVTGLLVTGAVTAPVAVAAPVAVPAAAPAAAAPTAAVAAATTAEKAVMSLLNRQRVQNGLPRLTRDPRLVRAAAGHNRAMAAAQTLSHQLPGEPSFDQRITNAGYAWRAAAENIGYTTNTTDAGAVSIQQSFYNETPPNDGHRRNILSTAVTQVGVSVLVDRGRLWVTVDFAAPR